MVKHVPGRVVVKVDVDGKNWFSFSDGTVIRLERGFDNLDRRYTEQVLGVVVDGEHIPADALILFHHNSLHATYEVHNHSTLSGEELSSGIKIYSILERDCFFWKMSGEQEWNPTKGFEKALRVFKPYEGPIHGIEPTLIKDTLYVLTGEFLGQIVQTVKAADYEITFRNEKGVDEKIIRFRPNGIEEDQREPEAICLMLELTKELNEGKLLVGFTPSDAKKLNGYGG